MSQKELINGSMFLLLRKFVESGYDHKTWLKLAEVNNREESGYSPDENYPISEMYAIISKAAEMADLSENELKEAFGEFLVPNLLSIYHKYINPSWKTFDMLIYTESIMHHAVRKENENANPPALHVSKVSDTLLIIDYYSKRKLASLAIGIIKGIAKHYNEADNINVTPVTNPDDERVQIRVNYIK